MLSIGGSTASKVINSGFQTGFPRIEMHRGEFLECGVGDVEVEGLTLTDEWSSIGGEVNENFLAHFPDGFVSPTDFNGDGFNVLDGTFVGNDKVFEFRVPQLEIHKVIDEIFIDLNEFSSESASGINVVGEGFKTFGVAEDLAGGSGRHRSNKE